MSTGVVKFYSQLQGIGFIKSNDGGPDVFVNNKTLKTSGLNFLENGQKVQFDLSEDSKRLPSVKSLRLI